MKLFKRFLALVMAAAVVTSFTACGMAEDNEDDSDDVYSYSDGLDENGYFEGVRALKIVTLPEYEGLDIPVTAIEASEEDINEQVEIILNNYDSYEEVYDRAVADGDTVNIDHVGYDMNGKPISGTNTGGLGVDVTIGVTAYIGGFLEQLVGHNPGESFTIDVTFPENHSNAALAGTDAQFKITINHIHGEIIEAVMNDELAVELGYTDVADLREDIAHWLVANERFQIFKGVIAEATCEEVPDSVIEYIKNYDMDQYNYYATSYGITLESYVRSYLGYDSVDAYVEAQMENYKESAIMYLAAQAMAEKEKIKITDADIEEAGQSDYVEEFGKPYIKQFMLFQEILPNLIVERGNVIDTASEK